MLNVAMMVGLRSHPLNRASGTGIGAMAELHL